MSSDPSEPLAVIGILVTSILIGSIWVAAARDDTAPRLALQEEKPTPADARVPLQ